VEAVLLAWFHEHGRDLPWRRTRDPYAILVSEVMLQQTQVERVIPRYLAWLERWPSVAALILLCNLRLTLGWCRPLRAADGCRFMSSDDGGVRSVGTGALARAFGRGFACFGEAFAAFLPPFFGRFVALAGFFFMRFLAIEILSNP